MSRLFKQIQRAQPKEPVFITPLATPFKQQRKFNLLPSFCIISLFVGIVVAYFYTDQDTQPQLSEKGTDITSSIQETTEVLAEDSQQPLLEDSQTEIPTQKEEDFESVFPGKRVMIR